VWGSGDTAPPLLTSALDAGERSVSWTGRFILEKRTSYPLQKRRGRPQSRSGRCGFERNFLPLPGIDPRPSSMQPIAIPTELPRLLKNSNVYGPNHLNPHDSVIPKAVDDLYTLQIMMLPILNILKNALMTKIFSVLQSI
jgi:hypothetical protein